MIAFHSLHNYIYMYYDISMSISNNHRQAASRLLQLIDLSVDSDCITDSNEKLVKEKWKITRWVLWGPASKISWRWDLWGSWRCPSSRFLGHGEAYWGAASAFPAYQARAAASSSPSDISWILSKVTTTEVQKLHVPPTRLPQLPRAPIINQVVTCITLKVLSTNNFKFGHAPFDKCCIP